MHKVARIGIAAVLAVGLFLAGAVAITRGGTETAEPAVAAPDAATLLAPGTTDSLEDTIASLQTRLRERPDDWRSFASLGLAYVQQARITADPSSYPRAEAALRRSLDLQTQDNVDAMVGMAALAAARHDFEVALEWGERARKINPYDASVYGVIGDAQVELGRYHDAFATFQTMVDTRPDLASYARVSYARELQGDVAGAIEAMEGAESFAGTPADRAWVAYQLGELSFHAGRLGEAAAHYRRGAQLAPAYVPPQAGLARVAWARGDVQGAIDRYLEVTARYPSPEYVIALGELYEAAGEPDLAREQFELVATIQQLLTVNGVNVDLELSLYEADHGDPAEALATARAEWDRRRSIHVADALAWALHANGRDREAARYAAKALSLGTRDALFLFHAGMIQLRLGDRDAARTLLADALDTNPFFSIRYSAVASDTLRSLGGAR